MTLGVDVATLDLMPSMLQPCYDVVTLKLVSRLWENVVVASVLSRHCCYGVVTPNILVDVPFGVATLELMSRHSSLDVATLEFGVTTFLNQCCNSDLMLRHSSSDVAIMI